MSSCHRIFSINQCFSSVPIVFIPHFGSMKSKRNLDRKQRPNWPNAFCRKMHYSLNLFFLFFSTNKKQMKRSWNLHSWFMDQNRGNRVKLFCCSHLQTTHIESRKYIRTDWFWFCMVRAGGKHAGGFIIVCATRTKKSIETNSVPKMRVCVMRVSVWFRFVLFGWNDYQTDF